MTEAVYAMTDQFARTPTAPLREFIAAYEEDDNIWWRIACGHHMNLFDAAMELVANHVDAEQAVLALHQPHCITCGVDNCQTRRILVGMSD